MRPPLYSYQEVGVDYLVRRGGGFVWDEPGLGKTRQAIVAAKKIGGPALIVCPNALKSWWREEIRTLYPNDRILVAGIGGRFGRKKNIEHLMDKLDSFPFWVIVHYEGIRLNMGEIRSIPWRVVIADECHFIKNRKAQRTQALFLITPQYAARIGLTATPFGKNPADLWSQLHWMVPESKALRSYWRFYNLFVDYLTVHSDDKRTDEERAKDAADGVIRKYHGPSYRKVNGGKNLEDLAVIMNGFGLQRTKAAVAPDIPLLTETYLPLALDDKKQLTYYKRILKAAVEVTIGEVDIIVPNVLARVTKLERIISHPWEFDPTVKGVKFDWLMQWAEQQKYPVVVATNFKATARYLAKALSAGTPITGDIPLVLRDGIIGRWQQGSTQFLVGTIATIGTGLNLQHAYTMVCYDQIYNPIYMEQLKHRIHRVNLDHPVEVIYPYVEKTTNVVIMQSFRHRLNEMEYVRLLVEYLQKMEDFDD